MISFMNQPLSKSSVKLIIIVFCLPPHFAILLRLPFNTCLLDFPCFVL